VESEQIESEKLTKSLADKRSRRQRKVKLNSYSLFWWSFVRYTWV